MGTKELRETFNSVTGPLATCTAARLTYERPDGKEVQILTFEGILPDGMPFSIRSEPIPPRGVVELAARETAQRLLEQKR